MRGAWRIAGTARYGGPLRHPEPGDADGVAASENDRIHACGRPGVGVQSRRSANACAMLPRNSGPAASPCATRTRTRVHTFLPSHRGPLPELRPSSTRSHGGLGTCEFVCGLFLPVFSFPLARFKAEKIGGRWCSPPSRRLAPPRYAVPPPASPPACGPLDSPAQPPVPLCHGRDHIARRAHAAAGIQRERASGHAAGGKGGWWRGRALHRT